MTKSSKKGPKPTGVSKTKGEESKAQLIVSLDNVLKSNPGKANIPDEKLYLEATEQYLPFSTSLRADQYLKLKRLEYWSRMSIREIVENMMDLTLDKFPDSKKKLPESERAKLKQIKTANDYYHEKAKSNREIQEIGRKLREGKK
jgi:hypothetical protein